MLIIISGHQIHIEFRFLEPLTHTIEKSDISFKIERNVAFLFIYAKSAHKNVPFYMEVMLYTL